VADGVHLRAVADEDLRLLNRRWTDPELAGEFQWFGFRPQRGLDLERRLGQDGLIGVEESWLVVSSADCPCAGAVVWRPVGSYGNWEIGCGLFPEHRGHGIGTQAQRLLVEYLFATTPANRAQAGTEAGNVAEQRALEKAGFKREGVMRGLYFRAGAWRDSVLYGITRGDVEQS
jgi:RimJ/RimL family protein N-acetyltransferase